VDLEQKKALARRYWDEIWNQGSLDLADEIFTADFLLDMPPPNQPLRGPQGVKDFVTTDRAAYSGLAFTLDDQVAEGNEVITRWTMRGTHAGVWHGIPATGKDVEFVGVTAFRFQDDKIAGGWVVSDALGLMRQLGVFPPPKPTS